MGQSAELRAAEGEMWRCAAFCGRRDIAEWLDRIGLVGGGGETSGRRLQRTGMAAAASRTAPDGPPTDSEHAECFQKSWELILIQFLCSC